MTDFADRYVTLPDPLAAFDEAVIDVSALLVAAEIKHHPGVPLGGWTFDQLRHHVAELCDEYAAEAEGMPAEPLPDRGGDYSKAFARASVRARKAFRRPGFLHARVMSQLGPVSGSMVVQHVVNELVTHACDIAHAIGVKVRVPDAIVDRCRMSWEIFFETYGRPELNFDPEQPAPPGASAADRLAAYLGRTISI